MDSDIIIVGAGVVGCALARVLSRYDCNVVVLEKADDVAEGTSKANSGIVHAGFDAHPGSLKARLNVEGAAMYPALCEELGVPYSCPGALVLGFGEADRATIEKLVKQGAENGVPGVRLIEREEIMAMEPNVNGDVVCALYAPTSGLTSPYELTYALADHAALNGVRFERDTEVTDVKREGEHWRVQTNRGEYRAKVFVNCAGVFAGEVHNMISDTKLNIIYRRGQYYLLDRVTPLPFRMTMFQCPTRMGKGVLVSPTVHGNVLLGPTAEDIPDGSDVSTTADGLAGVLQKARLTWPNVSVRAAITNFSGVRAHEENDDFVIGRVSGAENAFEAAGIESPGLSAAPAIAEMLGGQIAEAMGLAKKADYHPALPQPKPGRTRCTVRQYRLPLRDRHRGGDPRGDPPPRGGAERGRREAPHARGHGALPGRLLQPPRDGDPLRGAAHPHDRCDQVRRRQLSAQQHHSGRAEGGEVR